MKLSDFQNEYHWMNGLSEYFKFTGQEERWEHIHKALYHDNWYRKRDVIVELLTMVDAEERHVRAWMNALLHEKLEDVELKPQLLATLFRKYMKEDEFLVNICKFVNYWSGEDGEAAKMPDMNDFLSRGQVKSKLWMVTELAKIVEGPLGNVAFYGGWYNFMAHFLFDQFEVDKVYSLDVDSNVVDPSKRLYPKQVKAERFLPKTINVSKIKWNDKVATVPTNQTDGEDPGEYWELDTINMIVNTSCEHMNNEWYNNLPSGTFVVLQTNDYFSNPQHSNCVKDLEEAKSKYPMQSIMYEGKLDTDLYNRFMLIGIK
tara:strand:+ start:781 stop:1728 length:948 start_codon:yes stop_codon:yes gene_type:complete